MFNHIMIGTNDIEKSKAFYEKVLAVLGGRGAIDNTSASGHQRAIFIHDGNTFMLTQPIDGEAATCANGKELHDVAVANGATSIEGPPGPRDAGQLGIMHLSYFRDLDGHKICGIHREA